MLRKTSDGCPHSDAKTGYDYTRKWDQIQDMGMKSIQALRHVFVFTFEIWLPVKARIQYKIACLCFQCIYQTSVPPYISDLLHPYCLSRTLRSLDTSLLTVPRFSLETFGKKSFSVFGPTVWNSLPQCFTTFKAKLKTHFFRTHLC